MGGGLEVLLEGFISTQAMVKLVICKVPAGFWVCVQRVSCGHVDED